VGLAHLDPVLEYFVLISQRPTSAIDFAVPSPIHPSDWDIVRKALRGLSFDPGHHLRAVFLRVGRLPKLNVVHDMFSSLSGDGVLASYIKRLG
jgi:hypothetical protein